MNVFTFSAIDLEAILVDVAYVTALSQFRWTGNGEDANPGDTFRFWT